MPWPLSIIDTEGERLVICYKPFCFSSGTSNTLIPITRDYDHLRVKNWTVCNKIASPPGSLLLKGQGTQHTTVTWPTVNDDLIDLSRIPVNKVTNSRLGWTKYSGLYEIFHPSLALISLCLLTGA